MKPSLNMIESSFHCMSMCSLQINVIGTLLSVVLPAVFPQCHKYKECGSYFIANDLENYFIEDSPDGLIVCCSDCKGATVETFWNYLVVNCLWKLSAHTLLFLTRHFYRFHIHYHIIMPVKY